MWNILFYGNTKFFSFGINWRNYVKNVVNEHVIEQAKKSLLKYLPQEEFENKIFIDVGCGSGIFSLASLLLGVKKVISFDKDKLCIETTYLLKEKFKNIIPRNSDWEIFVADIMDENFVKKYEGNADIVYSWGVLHHTGNMWQAIRNTQNLLKTMDI